MLRTPNLPSVLFLHKLNFLFPWFLHLNFSLFVCVFVWFVFFCVGGGVLLFCGSSGSVLDEVQTQVFQNTRPQEIPASPFQQYDGCIGWLILNLHLLQTFVELARCERVMTTRAEFHFSWVYTFSATPRSLRIWASDPPRETGCDTVLPTRLCWSSDSSFPYKLYNSM